MCRKKLHIDGQNEISTRCSRQSGVGNEEHMLYHLFLTGTHRTAF